MANLKSFIYTVGYVSSLVLLGCSGMRNASVISSTDQQLDRKIMGVFARYSSTGTKFSGSHADIKNAMFLRSYLLESLLVYDHLGNPNSEQNRLIIDVVSHLDSSPAVQELSRQLNSSDEHMRVWACSYIPPGDLRVRARLVDLAETGSDREQRWSRYALRKYSDQSGLDPIYLSALKSKDRQVLMQGLIGIRRFPTQNATKLVELAAASTDAAVRRTALDTLIVFDQDSSAINAHLDELRRDFLSQDLKDGEYARADLETMKCRRTERLPSEALNSPFAVVRSRGLALMATWHLDSDLAGIYKIGINAVDSEERSEVITALINSEGDQGIELAKRLLGVWKDSEINMNALESAFQDESSPRKWQSLVSYLSYSTDLKVHMCACSRGDRDDYSETGGCDRVPSEVERLLSGSKLDLESATAVTYAIAKRTDAWAAKARKRLLANKELVFRLGAVDGIP